MSTVKELSPELEDAFKDVSVIALDIEGVDLGRNGKISLVQISPSPTKCFLLDLLQPNTTLVCWLRDLLESKSVLKIIHDCRMDSDALKHLLSIDLTNVHDTSCWHFEITGTEDVALNGVLAHNGIKQNVIRDSRVYAANHAFWATRPLTAQMIEWAAGDVSSMFQVYAKQVATSCDKKSAENMGEVYLNAAKTAEVANVSVNDVGAFIGRGGINIRALQKRTNTLIYPRGSRTAGLFMVYYQDAAGLLSVQKRAKA
jgi:ribonuclease D